eukprot:CAMPEP_0195300644 /NCGR_PEP_ID=MMETSP0707-20130614/27854_1 /TAXON_ID=33640 /ORGANISM="Asterionellopsis glacialis, Strain CCMP134" /LENGTH=62 /DNA_ID=CAMNT_0040363397 /DNA_START=46 /DNA_END=234 /DNA_ORIENTATION=-
MTYTRYSIVYTTFNLFPRFKMGSTKMSIQINGTQSVGMTKVSANDGGVLFEETEGRMWREGM